MVVGQVVIIPKICAKIPNGQGEARESRRDAQTLKQMNAPKPSANTLN